ncbi:MAG: hypothetical protein JST53_03205 [Actinobacteria bacterium]|nr:hypothetical protein [Actinomycetota bacterium]
MTATAAQGEEVSEDADAAEGLVASAVSGAHRSDRTFRPHMENRIPDDNTAP